MEIKKTLAGSRLTLALDGQLDMLTSKQLETMLISSTSNVSELIIDCKDLSFITSAGLRVLAIAQKNMKRQGHLVILDPQPDVQEVLDITGLSNFLEIVHSDGK